MRVIINFLSKIGVDSVSRLIGFLTLPFITRILGPEGYGAYSYLFVIVSYYGFFIDFGYLNYGTNKLCEREKSEDVIGRILSLQILTAIITYAVIIISGLIFFEREKFLQIFLFSTIFIPQIIAIKYFYLATNKLYFNSFAELSGQIVYALLVFTFFSMSPGINTLVVIAVIQALITGLVLFIPYLRNHEIRFNLNLRGNLETLKEAYKLGLSSKAEGITSSFIILITGMFLTEQSVGLYNASYKVYLILLTIIQGLSYAMMPMLLKNIKESGKTNIRKVSIIFYSFVLSGAFLGINTYFFSERIVTLLFGSDFVEAIPVLKWFSLTIMLWPLVIFSGLMLLANNSYGRLLVLSIISMCTSIAMSLLLINSLGITGSALVLPVVSVISAISGAFLIRSSYSKDRLRLRDIISPYNLLAGLKEILKRNSS